MASLNDLFDHGAFDMAKQYVAESAQEHVLCRLGKHVTDELMVRDLGYTADGGWWELRDCERCTTEIKKFYNANRTYSHSEYKYPDGYRAEEGSGYALVSRSGRAAMNEWRRTEIERRREQSPAAPKRRRRSKP